MSGNFYKLTMNDVPIAGKTVLVRADYNVPLTADGRWRMITESE
jgi:3-phosphoglycerate kinase